MLGSSTKKILIFLAVFITIACSGIYGMYYIISKAGHKVAGYELQQQKLISELEADRSLKQFLATSGPDIEKLSSRIVSRDGTVAFLEMIEKIARDTGLIIDTESVNVAASPINIEEFETLNLVLSTRGTWSNTYRFLSILETLPYKVTITGAEINQLEEGVLSEGISVSTTPWSGSFTFNVIKYK
ncbi:hypothetical protein H0W32_01395 [Patescibacteria group bacterium]|nr:hypothetical protein [Patescibacteria group bacterium]